MYFGPEKGEELLDKMVFEEYDEEVQVRLISDKVVRLLIVLGMERGGEAAA